MNANHYIPKDLYITNAVHAIWQVEGVHLFQQEYIIPKGVVEVIFNFSDSASIPVQMDGKTQYLPNCFINGFNTKPIELQLPEKQVFFGVLFQPTAVKKIFKTPACQFSDITVDLTLLNTAFNTLWHQLAEQKSFDSRVAVFRHWLAGNIIDPEPREQLIDRFLYADGQHGASVMQLANTFCYSPRHLSRKLYEATGMNTEELLLYKKYLHAVDLIHKTQLSLTDIAYQSRFSDQSHFIKTFKAYTQITPGEYKRNRSNVKGHIYKHVR